MRLILESLRYIFLVCVRVCVIKQIKQTTTNELEFLARLMGGTEWQSRWLLCSRWPALEHVDVVVATTSSVVSDYKVVNVTTFPFLCIRDDRQIVAKD